MFMRTYASSREWTERAFIEKVNSKCFCWFPVAILVDQNGPPIWCLHTKIYKVAWNVSANNSETVFIYKSFTAFHFLGSFHWTVSNLFFCCVTVKTIYCLNLFLCGCFSLLHSIMCYVKHVCLTKLTSMDYVKW